MTKRFISMLLVLVMLAAMIVVPVTAQTEAVQPETVTDLSGTCPCGCGENLTDVQWTRWDPNAGGTPSAGHYYLDGDYVQKDQQEIISGNKIVLDLRGHTLTTDDHHRLFLLRGYLAVLDTVGGGLFSAKTTGAGFGGIVMVGNNETNDATFEFYGGTMMPDPESKGSRRGGLVHLSDLTTFRMYGGRLMNGTTVNSGTNKEPGGAIAGNSATALIEILGGEIIGCESFSSGGSIYSIGTTVLKNCRIIGGVAATGGGNIHQAGGTLTIENCEISNGIANTTSSGGGNIAVTDGAVVDIKDTVISNGYTVNHGGNIYVGNAAVSIENTEVYSGVAGVRGGNIYGSTSVTKMEVKDCEIPGDFGFVGAGLSLSGKVKIGLLNTGLRLIYGSDKATVDASGLTEGSEIFVLANHSFADTTANPAYFKGSNRTVLSETVDGLVGTYAASGELGGYCPHCNERVVWNAFSLTDSVVQNCLQDSATDTDPACTGRHIESGHYFLGASMTGFTQHYVGVYISGSGTAAAKDVVLDLSGYSITSSGRVFYTRPANADAGVPQSSLTLMDSYGGGKVTGSGAANQGGGVIYNEGSVLTIYGGKYVYNPVAGRNITGGGVIVAGTNCTIHGGVFDGSAFVYTDQSTSSKTYKYNGGAITSTDGVKYFTMTAGAVLGGHAKEGGAVFFGNRNTVNITGGQFIGGYADGSGGAIRLSGASSYTKKSFFNMSGVAVRDGYAATSGGNVYTQYYQVTLENCYLDSGSTGDFGGNINNGTEATVIYTNCLLINGSAKRGGNFYAGATSAYATITNTSMISGTATTYAGNMNAGNGYIDIIGGEILYGTAATYGGNIANTAGNYSATSANYLRIGANNQGNAILIAGGKAGTTGGNIHQGGVLYLDAAQVTGGTAGTTGNDIHMNKLSKQCLLSVGSATVGEMSVFIDKSYFEGDGFGSTIQNTACTVLNARITLEGDYDGALLCAANGKLCIGSVAVVDAQGNYTWHTDAGEAIAACPADGYIRLFAAQDIVLNKDCAIDICGQTVNVSGAYTLYGMDSSGDEFTIPTGKVIAAGETTVASNTDVGGKQYVALTEDNGVSFHRIQAQITDVALRPSADGLYYTGSFGCDERVGSGIVSYGVAVSTVNMPGTDFMTDGDTLYTEFAGATMENGAKKTGVLIEGILKETREAALNSAYGQMPVFATAYLKLADGTVILSDTESHNDDIAFSLYDLLATLDTLIMEDPINYRPLTNSLRSFHNKWNDDGMGEWELNKIPDPGDNGVIDVLMIGGSFNYYYVEELYGMAEAAGIPMRVCNLYYSGAGPKQHWTWWKNQESPCQFFNTDGNGRVKTDNVSLEWALAQGEWDVLSLQYPSGTVRTATPQQGFDDLDKYSREMSDYLHEQFPNAMQCWGQVWGYQVGYNRDGYQVPDRETQLGLYQRHKEIAYMAADAYERTLIPCGEAWEFVRQGGYDNLCARLGKGTNHEGDYYHEGDIGGGQYLNACVWFEMITGESCVGNTYVPSYVYSEKTYNVTGITLEELQNAAHRAVEELKSSQF